MGELVTFDLRLRLKIEKAYKMHFRIDEMMPVFDVSAVMMDPNGFVARQSDVYTSTVTLLRLTLTLTQIVLSVIKNQLQTAPI